MATNTLFLLLLLLLSIVGIVLSVVEVVFDFLENQFHTVSDKGGLGKDCKGSKIYKPTDYIQSCIYVV